MVKTKKELIYMTLGHELRGGGQVAKGNGDYRVEGGERGKTETTVIA